MSLRFRPARTDDIPAVVALLQARELPTDGVAALMRSHPERVRIAELSGMVVGSAALDVHEPVALLRSVAVARDLAALGVGTRLVQDLIAQARASQLTALYLLTTTAAAWFPKFGFAVTNRDAVPAALAATVEFTSACPASATVMRVDLAPADVSVASA
jgi:amino-acid N-acetyltransferase